MWTNQFPQNLKIVVLNNNGGQIFNWIDGPSKEPQLKPYIETPQQYHLYQLCAFYGVQHELILYNPTEQFFTTLIDSQIQCFEFQTSK